MWYVCDVLYAVLYVRVSCFVVCVCAVSKKYINVFNCDMFSIVNVHLDHLRFCVLMVDGMSVVVNVMLSLTSVMSPPPVLCNLLTCTVVKLCIFGAFVLGGERGFLNCDDMCMCIVNTQFQLLEFVFDSVYVDLQYDEISPNFTAGSVSLCL